MPLYESRSIPSKSTHKNRKHKKITRKTAHTRPAPPKTHLKKRNKLLYSPHLQHSHKVQDRLYYSDEHKPAVEQQEQTYENQGQGQGKYEGLISRELVCEMRKEEQEREEIIQKMGRITLEK